MKRPVLVLMIMVGFAAWTFLVFSCGGDGGGGSVKRKAFFTSTQGTADLSSWPEVDGTGLTGLDAADAICQARADAAGLSGIFVAWISDDSDDSYCRVHGLTGKKTDNCGLAQLPATAGPWFRMDGIPFTDRIDLLTGSNVIYSPVRYDEFGSTFDEQLCSEDEDNCIFYWTGTEEEGVANGQNCSNWTFDTPGMDRWGWMGIPYATVWYWTSINMMRNCSSENSLLCLELGSNNLLPDIQVPGGKVVFLSSETGSARLGSWAQAGSNTGIAAGDAICQSLAAATGLDNAASFKAWLSDSTTDAKDRLTSDGPWVRPDGMMVAASRSALVNSWLKTSISVTENGDYGLEFVHTGTLNGGVKSSGLCSDWTSSSGSISEEPGLSSFADDKYWTVRLPRQCSQTAALYCFED